ncbi:MAG: glucose-6-phosphate isomerase, partial [Planctomycetota bacterium]|nr:glucose-6-phosphate isomerase [Planctomycetota bacterium]
VVKARLTALGAWSNAVIVTGPDGPLRELARADGLPAYDVPVPVGGRFSVFTPAATVPLALCGIDVAALIAGGRAAAARCASPGGAAARLASLLVACERAGRNVVALWAYAERLESIGEWFRQLWAESLGKTRADGSRAGQTPLHCVGTTDQHSIQQLMVEGPRDKAVLVVAGPAPEGLVVPAGAGPASGHEMGAILTAMRRATTAEMVRAGCPALTFLLEDFAPASVGALLMTFLCATVVAGDLLSVNPFGQPGVEAAKGTARALLADPGGSIDAETTRLLGEATGLRTGI